MSGAVSLAVEFRAVRRGRDVAWLKITQCEWQTRHQSTYDDPQMPLLYVLRDNLGLHGPRFGCGLGQCGSCTVHIDGAAVRSCVTPLSALETKQKIVTLEGLGSPEKLHPVQKAFIDEQAAQCGYCINGMIMQSAAFLAKNKKPSEATSRTRSPTISAAAAPMPASCARSSAPRLRRKGRQT